MQRPSYLSPGDPDLKQQQCGVILFLVEEYHEIIYFVVLFVSSTVYLEDFIL